jgi:diadenosine tetraphosphate (Ap4A) HIT family hydrolase
MGWPQEFFEMRQGVGCPMCAEGRPDETPHGIRFFAGEVADAYLRKPSIQRGLSIVVWRGRHVAEPTEFTDDEARTYMQELFTVGRAIEHVMRPVKMNYNLLGNAVPHLHTHVVPRYADDPKPGWPFPFPETDPPDFPDDDLRRDVDALREAIG